MSIIYAFILNQDFTRTFSLIIINILKNFGFEILKNDAHNGDWKQYTTVVHLRFGHKITAGSMIVKLNSKNDVQAEGIFHPPEVHWLTYLNNSLHVHVDPSWSCCQKALRWIETFRGLFCIVRWAGLPSTVMGLSILSKGVETSPTAAQLGLACAQTMPLLSGVCLWQAYLFQMSYDRQI